MFYYPLYHKWTDYLCVRYFLSEIFYFMKCPTDGSCRSRSMYGHDPLVGHAAIMERTGNHLQQLTY